MANRGLCPGCGKRVLHVNVENVVGLIDGESRARCIAYTCIHCNVVLSIMLDPRAKPRPRRASTTAAAAK